MTESDTNTPTVSPESEQAAGAAPAIDLRTELREQPLFGSEYYLNYERSLLDFIRRVLREATDPKRNPLLDRVRFLAITATNLDEFFQKRVGALKRQLCANVTTPTIDGQLPAQQLQQIREEALALNEVMDRLFAEELRPGLREVGIELADYEDLPKAARTWLNDYYDEYLFPVLTPLAVDPGHPFPFISNLSLSLGIELRDDEGRWHFARVKVPPVRPRFLQIPETIVGAGRFVLCPIEQVLAANIQSLFTGMEVVSVVPFRVTRNAEIEADTDADDLLEMISEELRHRRYAPVVRLEVSKGVGRRLLRLLMKELEIGPEDVYRFENLLGQVDFFQLLRLPASPEIRHPDWTPIPHPRIARSGAQTEEVDLFALIRRGDLLVHHPYHSFESSVVNFVRQASRDPKVLAIKQTLYRTTEDSEGLRSLIEAAESGKQVAVLVELKARFDEARNIELAQRLEKSGVHVTYGLLDLKTHCKTTLVVREEQGTVRRYVHIGTGNYNPQTAKSYEDVGLFSCDPDLGEDLTRFFNYLTGYAPDQTYRKLLVAPRYLREGLLKLIEQEMAIARAGGRGRIVVKLNRLEDPQLIQALYRASQVGVEIDCIVRGVCRLIPGKPGLSEGIRIRSIVGRFLEHSRIFYFGNDGAPRIFIGSADIMRRNLDRRVEVLTPIEAPRIKAYLCRVLRLLLNDTGQSWTMQADGSYEPEWANATSVHSCHEELMQQANRLPLQAHDPEALIL